MEIDSSEHLIAMQFKFEDYDDLEYRKEALLEKSVQLFKEKIKWDSRECLDGKFYRGYYAVFTEDEYYKLEDMKRKMDDLTNYAKNLINYGDNQVEYTKKLGNKILEIIK